MINFSFDGKKYITVELEGLPQTIIKCDDPSNETVLTTCQTWLDKLGLTEIEYHVVVKLH